MNNPEIQKRIKELPQYFGDQVTQMMVEAARDPRFAELTAEEIFYPLFVTLTALVDMDMVMRFKQVTIATIEHARSNPPEETR